ncbi:endonuclease/exonuclease/phosphatase family protein [Salegentibacter salegens]|uniref:Metal-dependent hydrolase, endonuclease/exonuclease/phosphatase family n=1 Tax=Salegentibacter salegens TaxID=143223 RepID=A0A1M7HIX9_9FLAO|nr:endonuclease/exonuclease/phosphatase family protein [Salegentibacter salegens]PRX41375.1 endonuclease/exonuclease/phosphatase family metal-dependent hydrolase [Salegentibacter salegens]SHM28491.1 Metal-dependent hydrolase, endonuclease/exonuclease/phosphatase family [Salegentibacter salegens]
MKNLGLIDKIIFILNSLAATALLLSYLLAFIPPKSFPLLSVLSLGVPVLILINLVFMVYWIIRFKRQFLLSLIILLVGYNYVTNLYHFTGDTQTSEEELSIMSYNVRMFNSYEWTDEKDIPDKITNFIKEKDPDILLTQEHTVDITNLKEIYPYYFVHRKGRNSEFGSAIFSKYPILEKISVDFPHNGNNNAIYTDVVVKEDTLRIFNVHFQSLNIKPDIGSLRREDSKKLLGRIGYGFSLQQEQAEMMMEKVNKTPYKTIIAGDFNNTAFSYIYEMINKEDRFTDAFLHSGEGFGQTFKLNYFPLRIDFIWVDNNFQINDYKRFKNEFSDHYPIITKIKI